jgi:hypothetical protein
MAGHSDRIRRQKSECIEIIYHLCTNLAEVVGFRLVIRKRRVPTKWHHQDNIYVEIIYKTMSKNKHDDNTVIVVVKNPYCNQRRSHRTPHNNTKLSLMSGTPDDEILSPVLLVDYRRDEAPLSSSPPRWQ